MKLKAFLPSAVGYLLITLLLCLFLAGCGTSFPRADLTFLNGAEPETLDPGLLTGQPDMRVAEGLFEGLTAFDAAAKPIPGVAQSWEISPDGRVYTFHLRPDARWSNGDPVTADDFLRSWRRVLAPETGSDYASQLYHVRNGRAFNEGKLRDFSQVGVRVIDPATLEVTLENPTSYFLELCAVVTLMPVHFLIDRFPAIVVQGWKVRLDGRVYTFRLRPDARWSNGDPVTADDFIRAWRPNPSIKVRAVDAVTLKVTPKTPYSSFPADFLNLWGAIALKPVERLPDDWTKPGKMVSNGAYVLSDWRVNDRIRLAKNPYYWNRDKVAMKTVNILPISKANTAFNFYAAGQADLVMDKGLVPNQLLDELKKRPDFHAAPFLCPYFLRFNCTRPPFNDSRVRRAFALVIDKKLLVDKITRAGERPAFSLTPPGAGGYEPPPGPPRDPAGARRLLAEAGYPGGKGFPRISYLYSEGELNEGLAVEMQAMFQRELGVHIDLQRQEWKVYLRSMSTLDYDLCRSTWVADYNDPNTFLGCFVTGDGNNRTGWSNPKYDALIADAAREPDPQRRFDIFRQAEHLLVSEATPICPLYYFVGIQFYDSTRLGGIQANLLDEHPLKAMYWK